MAQKSKEYVRLVRKRVKRPGQHKKNVNKRNKPKAFLGMSKTLLEYKIIPRGMMLAFTVMAWNVCDWFMGLGTSATTQQTAFVSTIVGAATGAFAVWMANESK